MTFATVLRRVYVTTRFDGMHSWPQAPATREYLSYPHRHLFHVKLTVDVVHDDRDIEFHDLLDHLHDEVRKLKQLGSCEQIAGKLAERTTARYPKRRVECEVSEDGENGATVTLLP